MPLTKYAKEKRTEWLEGECKDVTCPNYTTAKKKTKKKETAEKKTTKIIKPKNRIFDNEKPQDISEACIICKNCKKVFIYNASENEDYDWEEEFYECPNCGTSNTLEESRKLINNLSKNNETNKTKS